MKYLTKIRQSARIEGRSYKEILISFLSNFRNTPHSATGKTPAELMFAYQHNSTKLPNNRRVEKTTQMMEAELADWKAKYHMKEDYDSHGYVKETCFSVGDRVRVMIPKEKRIHKLITPFSPETYIISKIDGLRITAVNNYHTIVRSKSQFQLAKDIYPPPPANQSSAQQQQGRKRVREEDVSDEDYIAVSITSATQDSISDQPPSPPPTPRRNSMSPQPRLRVDLSISNNANNQRLLKATRPCVDWTSATKETTPESTWT